MRTEYCGQLRLSHVGQQVTLCGWVNRRRDLGSLIFIDMRDREGIVQVFFDPDRADALKLASELRNEFCIQVTGTVRARDAKTSMRIWRPAKLKCWRPLSLSSTAQTHCRLTLTTLIPKRRVSSTAIWICVVRKWRSA